MNKEIKKYASTNKKRARRGRARVRKNDAQRKESMGEAIFSGGGCRCVEPLLCVVRKDTNRHDAGISQDFYTQKGETDKVFKIMPQASHARR